MTKTIIAWAPYAAFETIVSNGRRTLVSAFGDLVLSRQGFPPYELPEIFAAPEDEGENDACRHLVMMDAAFLTTQFVLGKIPTFARPIGGGEAVTIAPSLWELDDSLPRMATGALNLERWADPEAPLTHRIFVDGPKFDAWLAGLKPVGYLTTQELEEALDPQLRASRAVAARRVDPSLRCTELEDDTQRLSSSALPHEFEAGLELLKLPEVEALVKFKRSAIYEKIGEGLFPKPIPIGAARRWRKRDVLLWIEEQAAKRGNDHT